MRNDLLFWVWLNSLPKLSPRRKLLLLEYYRCPEAIWSAGREELRQGGLLTEEQLEPVVAPVWRQRAEEALRTINRMGIKTITMHDENYPVLLKKIYDPPVVLYMLGSFDREEKAVAVVGSRRASPYGRDTARNLAYDLARQGVTIVSGMARGVDSAAHRGAIEAGGRTVAVLGCGLDRAYPYENKELMKKIAGAGAVISEYIPGTPPLAQNFPARNRIISGLCLGTVVIEAGEKSGSLITADFSLDQGREVFAVPGNVGSKYSVGTNNLLKEGAKLVTGAADVLEELNLVQKFLKAEAEAKKTVNVLKGLDRWELELVKILEEEGSLHIDRIAARSGLSLNTVSSALTMLELKGLAEQLPGKVFRLRL